MNINENEEIEANDNELFFIDESVITDSISYATTQELHATERSLQLTSKTSAILHNKANTPALLKQSSKASPAPSTTSTSVLNEKASISSDRIQKKRKAQSEDAYVKMQFNLLQNL